MYGSFGVLLHEVVSGLRPHPRHTMEPLRCASWHVHLARLGPCKFLLHWVERVCTGHGRLVTVVHVSVLRALTRRVPEDCPQGVADLWRACMAVDPSVRPSAANVLAALKRLQSVPRPAQPPPAHAAADPPTATSAGHDAPHDAERGAGASCSGMRHAGSAPDGCAGASGAVTPGQPANGQHANGRHEGG